MTWATGVPGLGGRPGRMSSPPLPSHVAQVPVPSLDGGWALPHRTPNPETHWIPAPCFSPTLPSPSWGYHKVSLVLPVAQTLVQTLTGSFLAPQVFPEGLGVLAPPPTKACSVTPSAMDWKRAVSFPSVTSGQHVNSSSWGLSKGSCVWTWRWPLGMAA